MRSRSANRSPLRRLPIGRPAAPTITFQDWWHTALRRARVEVCPSHLQLWRGLFLPGEISAPSFIKVMEGRAPGTSKNLSAVSLIGSALGLDPDRIVIGRSLPTHDPQFVIERLQRLADITGTIFTRQFSTRRIAEVHAAMSNDGPSLADGISEIATSAAVHR